MSRPSLLGESLPSIEALVAELSLPAFRAKQLWQWLHQKRIDSFNAMSNLPQNLREALAQRFRLRLLREQAHQISADQLTEKWLFDVNSDQEKDENGQIESVLIREKRLRRHTVCISCMIGCPLGCAFCATGGMGFVRNLSPAEIVEQVYRIDANCRPPDSATAERMVTNIVFMGMGEPLLNLDAVLAAADIFAHPDGFGLSRRHITLSTVGIPDAIRRLATMDKGYRLAVSLHAPEQSLRETLIPVARQHPLPELMDALQAFAKTANRDITIEYCLIRDCNDHIKDAQNLIRLLEPIACKVNLIPLNPTPAFAGKPPTRTGVGKFLAALEAAGIPATVRTEKGQDIAAACGQLKAGQQKKKNTD